MKHQVENLLTGDVEEYTNNELIELAQWEWFFKTGEEKGEPKTLLEAFDYLNAYCDNLLLL